MHPKAMDRGRCAHRMPEWRRGTRKERWMGGGDAHDDIKGAGVLGPVSLREGKHELGKRSQQHAACREEGRGISVQEAAGQKGLLHGSKQIDSDKILAAAMFSGEPRKHSALRRAGLCMPRCSVHVAMHGGQPLEGNAFHSRKPRTHSGLSLRRGPFSMHQRGAVPTRIGERRRSRGKRSRRRR